MTKSRLLLLALVVSTAINLFLIGGILSRVNNSDEFSGRPLPPNVSWMVRDLSDERRAALQPLLEASAEELRPIRRAMFDTQRRVNELMADQEYKPEDLRQAFAELRAANLRYQELSHQHSVAMLDELSEAERKIAVELINRRGPREGRDRRFRDGDGPTDGPRDGPRDGRPDFGGGPPPPTRPPEPL